MSTEKKTRGRQKIDMKKISNESHLQVTFSKRRSGLVKKASELCTLCGVDLVLIIFSPSGKVFTFGHPNVHTIIDRYLSRIPPQSDGTMQFIEAHRSAVVRNHNALLTQISNMMDIAKRCGDELNHVRKMIEDLYWWVLPIDGMNMLQLELFMKALEKLKMFVAQYADRSVTQDATNQAIPFGAGNGFSFNMHMHHEPIPQAQTFSAQFFQNPMLNPHLLGFNNLGGGERQGFS